MGIKGVYGEIGAGERTALLKLAVQQRETSNRALKIAIDVSIWNFQIQSAKGGTNADSRTLFYRLLRLYRLAIQPLFVFDGPHRPPFKRNKRTNVTGGSALNKVATDLFDLFGYPYIQAHGEAEAECALLQKEGIVDAVLSEDVDTLMFGCTTLMRNWSSEGVKGNKTPTHVDVYYADKIKSGKSGLDREGMVLVALMSGGDYIPAGIPGCGPKVACEAARAGFGHDLFQIDRKDTAALSEWRERLQYELQSNESGFFRTKHKSISIPENFPDKAVLYYYKHPVVSNAQGIEIHRQNIKWGEMKVSDLRKYTVGAFDWRSYTGLRHFVRSMAPTLLGHRMAEGLGGCSAHEDMDTQAEEEDKVVKLISGRRNHVTADNVPELRIAYIPKDVVGLDFEAELQAEPPVPQTHTAIYSEDEEPQEKASGSETNEGRKGSPRRKRGRSTYDPTKVEKEWFPETYVKLGVPLTVERWEAEMRDPKKFATRKARARTKLQAGMPRGAIEPFLKVKKPGHGAQTSLTEGFEIPQVLDKHLPWDSQSLPFLPPSDLPRKGPKKSIKTSSLPLQQLSASSIPQPKLKATKLSLPISKVPSTTTAGDRSFRVSAKSQDENGSRKEPDIRSKKRPHQAKPVVILSSLSKPEPVPFDSPQKPLAKKRTIRVLENMREKKLQEQKQAQGEELAEMDLSDSSLPSPSAIFRSLHSKTASREQGVIVSAQVQHEGSRRVVLRESLNGSWKMADDYGQIGYATPRRGFSGVEVLDLTNS